MAAAVFDSLIQFILTAPRANGSRLNRDSKMVRGVLDLGCVWIDTCSVQSALYGIVSIQCATMHVHNSHVCGPTCSHYNVHGCEL